MNSMLRKAIAKVARHSFTLSQAGVEPRLKVQCTVSAATTLCVKECVCVCVSIYVYVGIRRSVVLGRHTPSSLLNFSLGEACDIRQQPVTS